MKALLIATNERLAVNVLQSLALKSIRTDVMSPLLLRWAGLSHYSGKRVSCRIEDLLESSSVFSDVINRYCRDEKIDIVIPVDVLPIACLAKLGDLITTPVFPIPTLDHILLLNNKWHLKQFLDARGIPTPQTIVVKCREEIFHKDIAFPVVVKPLDREGCAGVKRLNSKDEMDTYFSDRNFNSYWPILVQEYIPGYDICASILSERGEVICWTIQQRSLRGGIQFVEHPDILRSVCDICTELNYTGVAHFDVRVDDRDNSIKFLECNPRFWGSLTASTFAGINFAALGVSLGLQQRRKAVMKYQSGLRLSDHATNLSIISLLVRRRIPLNRASIHHLLQTLCDPPLVLSILTSRMWRRFSKIFIPGKIRRRQKKRCSEMQISIPPLSSIEAFSNLSDGIS